MTVRYPELRLKVSWHKIQFLHTRTYIEKLTKYVRYFLELEINKMLV